MINVNQTLSDLKSFFETLVNIRALNGMISVSRQTVSFYVYKDRQGRMPLQILRISDHRPDMFYMVRDDASRPSSEDFANLSIEFYVPKFGENGKMKQNKLKTKVKIYEEPLLKPFSVDSYSYTPELLTNDDVGKIFAAIMKWLFPSQDKGVVSYIAPFVNTDKEAKHKKEVSKIIFRTDTPQIDNVP
jgi:hypothetical protein